MQTLKSLFSYSRAKVALGLVAALSFLVISGSVLAAAPQVNTLPGTATATSITLSGTYSGNANTIQVRFEWGTTPNLGTFTSYQNFSSTNGTFSETLTGLNSGTTYYFRAEGINSDGPAWGSILNKTTVGYNLAQVQTTSYTNLTATSVSAGYWYNTDTAGTVAIQYANNSQMIGAYTSPSTSIGAGSAGGSIALTNLSPNTTYWYKAIVTNSAGTATAGTAVSFTTPANGGGNNTNNCVITSFAPNATLIASGGTVVLNWSTTNCTSVNVTGGGISSTNVSGSVTSGTLYGTTTFTLTATGSNGTISQTATVTVNNGGGNNGSACVINQFSASPATISAGGTATLYWSTTNCSYVVISGPGISGTYYSTSNSVTTSALYSSGSYSLTGYATDGTATSASSYVNVSNNNGGGWNGWPWNWGNNNQCVITNFYASPSQVQAGGTTTLYWNTQNCSSVTWTSPVNQNTMYNQLPTSGSSTIAPTSSGTFTLNAWGANGSTQATTYIQVTTINTVTTYACNDGIDNDGDGRVDSADPGCASSTDTSEYNVVASTNGGGTTVIQNGTASNGVLGFSSTVTSGSSYGNNLAGLALWGGSFFPTTFVGFLILILIILAIVLIAKKLTKNNHSVHDSGHSDAHGHH